MQAYPLLERQFGLNNRAGTYGRNGGIRDFHRIQPEGIRGYRIKTNAPVAQLDRAWDF